MSHKFRILHINFALALAAMLLFGGMLLPRIAPTAFADGATITLTPSGPSYVTAGSNITYELTLKSFTNQPITDITVWNPLPANTTYVSGGTLFAGENGVAFNLASLAANATHTFSLVVNVGGGVAVGTVIENKDIEIESFTVGGDTFGRSAEKAVGTTVEAPGTLVAIYKNANGTPFDVTVDGFQFENYGNDAPRVSKDDLDATDMFILFGPAACQSGTTAATCVLSGPARKWMEGQIDGMGGGHCEGMAATSLHIFDEREFKGNFTPADLQPGASSIIDLNFPAQTLENYISHYFITQSVDEYYDNSIVAGPVAIADKLTEEFNKATPVPYTLGFYLLPDFKVGHAVTAYGVETVSATESRILIYDNNYPKQRQYLVVNTAADTWRYETAATPGQEPDVYTGTATSENLSITPNNTRDLPAGQYFTCPFCNGQTNSASVKSAAVGETAGTIRFDYAGEGAFLVVNDDDQSTGFAFDTETFINEIPNAQVRHFKGGLGKDIPPSIVVPYVEADEALYHVFISGKTIDSVAEGSLTMTGEGYAMGLDGIGLDPDELLEVAVSPDGDLIAFSASETVTAPVMYISYDPVIDEDPSIIFEVDGIILDAGEETSLELDPDLERVYFEDSGALGQQFDITMIMIWPDGEEEEYTEMIDVPAGSTSAFIDFGAWDGLQDPPIYIDDVLQNPSVNHRLKLENTITTYDTTPQANAPAGIFHVKATFTNVTEITLEDVYFTVANLAEGNVLLNADGGPAGTGANISVPSVLLGDDGILAANESFSFSFNVGMADAHLSAFTVDANGAPHDWTPDADPPPTYDANDASFVFAVGAGGMRVYLPTIQR